MSEPVCLGSYRAKVGESSWWDAARQVHWSVDAFAPAVIRTKLSGEQHIWPMPELAGAVLSTTQPDLIVAMESGLFRFNPEDDHPPRRFAAPGNLEPGHRFNDLTVDAAGNIIVGTMETRAEGRAATGRLYRFDGLNWTTLAEGFFTINGLACAPDGNTLYWSDSAPQVNRIWYGRYDPQSGQLSQPTVFCEMGSQRGRPDGAAVDVDGGYWIAAVGGGCLHCFLPSGELSRTIDLPVDHPTKPAFAGAELDRIIVTSLSIRDSRPEAVALAGAIVSLDVGVSGSPIPAINARRFFGQQ